MATACSPNASHRIREIPEYIFVTRTEQKDEEMMSVDTSSEIVTKDTKKSASEMTAVAALSILGGSLPSSSVDSKEKSQDEEEEKEKEKEFKIPQRLTKTGRKRAVPFTLKVRTS
jgi:hypothetical protein